jgi:hypothetical protein
MWLGSPFDGYSDRDRPVPTFLTSAESLGQHPRARSFPFNLVGLPPLLQPTINSDRRVGVECPDGLMLMGMTG